jgi:hypothetical protein
MVQGHLPFLHRFGLALKLLEGSLSGLSVFSRKTRLGKRTGPMDGLATATARSGHVSGISVSTQSFDNWLSYT